MLDELPMVGVSWREANEFAYQLAKKVGFDLRLPSEAQWEYAARSAGKEEKYAGGYEPEEVAWFADNSDQQLQAVGRKKPNGIGLYDMCGNICEWCRDHYLPQAYAQHDNLNPVTRGREGDCHVVRGGSFCHGVKDVRCADRGLFVPDHKDQDLGFRLVRMR
jgi:formylglycine-generating enzyme required for sulfatase activity